MSVIDNFDFTAYNKLSYEQKKADDYKWIEDNCGYIGNSFYDSQHSIVNKQKIQKNYYIANALGKDLMLDIMGKNQMHLGSEGILSESSNVKYYDLIRRVLTRMWGENQKRNLNAIVADNSGYNQNVRKKLRLELFQDYMKTTVLDVMQQEAQQEVMSKYGKNTEELTPEEQQQVQSEIQQAYEFKKPEDIDDYMRKSYKSPSEKQLQSLVDWMIPEYNLKHILNEGYKDLTIAGFEVVELAIRNNMPYIDSVNPVQFDFYNPTSSNNIGDSEWFEHEKDLPFTTFINDYLSNEKEFKKFQKHVNSEYNRNEVRGEANSNVVRAIANGDVSPNPVEYNQDGTIVRLPKPSSKAGQNFYNAAHSLFGSRSSKDSGYGQTTRVCRRVFASLDKLGEVWRENPNKPNGFDKYVVGENYEPNHRLDKKVKWGWYKTYYEGTEVGYDGYFINKKRCDFQNRSANDPSKVFAPYQGTEFSKLHGNTSRITSVDLGKASNEEYNMIKNKIEELDETNIGRVFAFPDKALPDNWDIPKFLSVMKKGKIAPISLDNLDDSRLASVAAQMFKSVDLSNTANISEYLQRADMVERECQEAMSYSPSSMGLAPASMTATNNQQNIIQSSYANQDINSTHIAHEAIVVESFANLVRNSLRDNEHLRTYLLDDLSIAELEMDKDTLHLSSIGIKIVNDVQKQQDIASIKNLLQPMIQNQMLDMSDAIKLQFSDNPASIINLAERAEEKRSQQQQAQQQAQQEQQQQMMQIQQQQMEYQKQQDEIANQLKELDIRLRGDALRKQADADLDGQSDVLEKEAMTLVSKERSETESNNLKREEMQIKQEQAIRNGELKMRELEMKQELEMAKIRTLKEKQTK